MVESFEPEWLEREALEWSAARLRRVRTVVRGVFVGVGVFWVSLGLLIASLYFPTVRLVLLLWTGAVGVVFGAWFIALGVRFGRRFSHRIRRMEEMAEMSNVERHAHVARKVRRRRAVHRTRTRLAQNR